MSSGNTNNEKNDPHTSQNDASTDRTIYRLRHARKHRVGNSGRQKDTAS